MRLLKEPSICPSGHLCLLQWYQLQSACFYCACLCGCMYTFTQFHCLFLGLLFPSSSSTGSFPLSFSCSCVFLVGSLVNMLVCVCPQSTEVPLAFVCLTLVALVPPWWCGTKTVVSPVTKAATLSVSLCLLLSVLPLFSHSPSWLVNGCEMGSESTRPHARGPWHPFKQHMTSGGNAQT